MRLADRGAMGQLEVQQSPLQPKPTAVAAESASGRDNTMTGDHERQRIPAVGSTYRADGLRVAGPACQFAIRDGLAVGNRLHRAPHALAELTPFEPNWKREFCAFAGQVLFEFACHLSPQPSPGRAAAASVEIDACDCSALDRHCEASHPRIDRKRVSGTGHWQVNSGSRFWRNASMPSFISALAARRPK